MHVINEWVINIILFILLAMIIDMLLPNSNIRKYVKVVTGLLLMMIIVTPIFNLLSTDMDHLLDRFSKQFEIDDQKQESELEAKKKEIETSQHAYIYEQMAVQLKEEAEKELIDRHGMKITSIHITGDERASHIEEQVMQVTVHLHPANEDNTIATVKPVMIHVTDEQKRDSASNNSEKIKSLLAKEWDIPANKIEVVHEGRSR